MKKILTKIRDILFYMIAGLGLFSLLNLILRGFPELPVLLVVAGLGLGFLMWWKETQVMRETDFGGNINALKFYVYLFTLFVYTLAFFGFVEFFALTFGQSSIEVYKTISFSWEWLSVFLLCFLSWLVSSQSTVEDVMSNSKMQKI